MDIILYGEYVWILYYMESMCGYYIIWRVCVDIILYGEYVWILYYIESMY